MLEIRMFGPGQASYKGQPLIGFPHQQPHLLLCYLLLNRMAPHPREHLAAVFWGDCPISLARKNLRNSVWRLRQIYQSVGANLDKYLTINEEYVSFTHEHNYCLDIELFESGTRSNQDKPGQALSAEQVASLEAAVDLYTGDLLEGVYEDWCLYDRERLRLAYLNALTKLMVYHGLHGNYERGLGYGQRILALDALREKVHRYMMWIYWLSGDREAALAQYRSCCQLLQDELSIYPMKETQRLYETILRNPASPPGHLQSMPDESAVSPRTASNVLQKLHLLQMIVEQTNTELHLLEGMIHHALADGE